MTVYVDELKVWGKWRYGESCHMLPGSQSEESIEELHAFAQRIGMKREWFQTTGRWSHYDLTKTRRAVALKAGAVVVDTRQYLRAMRGEAQLPQQAQNTQAGLFQAAL